MSSIRVLIVEDELIVAEELSSQLEKLGFDVLNSISSVQEAKRALEIYQLDIILIDIKLKGQEDGIDLGDFISKEYSIPFIYTTSLHDAETVKRAAKSKPSAYLIKPYNFNEIQIAIEIALANFEGNRIATDNNNVNQLQSHYLVNDQVFIKENGRFERVQFQHIQWLKAENSYVKVQTNTKQYLLTSDTLGSFLEKLKATILVRIHRSYAININKVQAFEGNQVYIDEQSFPIGKNYKAVLREHFNIL